MWTSEATEFSWNVKSFVSETFPLVGSLNISKKEDGWGVMTYLDRRWHLCMKDQKGRRINHRIINTSWFPEVQIRQAPWIQHLCIQLYMKHFMYTSLNITNTSTREVQWLLSPFAKWDSWGLTSLSDLSLARETDIILIITQKNKIFKLY